MVYVRDLLLRMDENTPITIFSMNDKDILGSGFSTDLISLIGRYSIVHNIYIKDSCIWVDIWE